MATEERLTALEAELHSLRAHAEQYSAQVEAVRVQTLQQFESETQKINEKASAAVLGVQELYDKAVSASSSDELGVGWHRSPDRSQPKEPGAGKAHVASQAE